MRSTRSISSARGLRPSVLALAISACFPLMAQAQVDTSAGFTGLGSLGGTRSWLSSNWSARGISDDGAVVVGYSYLSGDSANHAFRWTAQDGMQDLGTLGGNYSYASGVSSDGSTVAGYSDGVGSNYHAFRWTAAEGMQDLGTLGGTYSYAYGLSADGAVVVGNSYLSGDGYNRAFRWTNGVMTDLGTLGGNYSVAYAVSRDGSTVVGGAYTAAGNEHAFRWTEANGMTDLGSLGGTYAYAHSVSETGAVVVGQSYTSGQSAYRAFRWTQAGGMADLGTLGGNYSYAYGMTPQGDVIVGYSDTGSGSRAFRWTEPTGMLSLGTLGGTYSNATDLSADGSVVVGVSRTTDDSSMDAFRWTEASGMQSVRDWLTSNGVAVADGWQLADGGEVSVNATGDVLVGNGRTPDGNYEVWFATSKAAVTLSDVQQSLVETASAGHAIQAATNTVLNGAHSRPLDRRVNAGQKAFWLAGDWGTDDHGARNGTLGLAEVGLGVNLGSMQLNGALGQTWSRQELSRNGHVDADGTYLMGEALIPVSGKLWAVFNGYVHDGNTEIRRGYLNAGNVDASTGTPDVGTWAVRARLEWDQAYQVAGADASPYVDLSHTRSTTDAYTETGGGAPASFNERKDKATELRVGVNLSKPLSGQMRLTGTLEAAHRFERHSAGATGQVGELFAFNLNGVRNQRTWLRAGVGLAGKLGGGTASVGLNLTTQGEAPSAWVGLRWQKAL